MEKKRMNMLVLEDIVPAMRVGFRPESGFELLLTECRGCQHIFKSDILSRHQDSNQHIIFKSDSQPTFSRHQQTSYLNIEIAIDTRHHISSKQPASSFRHQTTYLQIWILEQTPDRNQDRENWIQEWKHFAFRNKRFRFRNWKSERLLIAGKQTHLEVWVNRDMCFSRWNRDLNYWQTAERSIFWDLVAISHPYHIISL